MTEARHTPGPWAVEQLEVDVAAGVYRVSKFGIACRKDVARLIHSRTDARLIAAAPEMLEALQEIRPEIEREIEQRELCGSPEDKYVQRIAKPWRKCWDAIAKATGAA